MEVMLLFLLGTFGLGLRSRADRPLPPWWLLAGGAIVSVMLLYTLRFA